MVSIHHFLIFLPWILVSLTLHLPGISLKIILFSIPAQSLSLPPTFSTLSSTHQLLIQFIICLYFLIIFIFLSLLFKKVTYSNLRFLIYQETKLWIIISSNSLLRKITNVRIHISSPSQFCYDLRFLSQCIICFLN